MRRALWMGLCTTISLAVAAASFGACSALDSHSTFGEQSDDDDDDDGGGGGGAGAGNTGTAGTGGININVGGQGGGGVCTSVDPANDWDEDEWTVGEGDCNDCDPMVNPAAIEVPTDPNDPDAPEVDEDCDGDIDEPIETCDDGLALDDVDPISGAAAIDICQQATPADRDWGLLSAQYVTANGSPRNPGQTVGIMTDFGPNMPVRHGERMLALSSGYARLPATDDAVYTHGQGTAPPEFPQNVPNCEGGPGTEINDDIGLELTLRAPSNADGYSFDFSFYSFEFPEYVCTTFNDQFIALVSPEPPGSINGNISFDSQTNPVSVNIAMFDVCDPSTIGQYAMYCFGGCPSPPNPYCPMGPGELQGNGFDGYPSGNEGGATSWLVTTAPIGAGDEFTIRFAIWDTGDQILDSSVVIDNFEWIANAGEVEVGTIPVPE